jgi:F0F1-type ATP synthase membrane subunit c/vacuolar-type H+-ATPase subunit K
MHRVDDSIGAACIDDGLLVPDEGGNQGAITRAIIDSISRNPRAPDEGGNQGAITRAIIDSISRNPRAPDEGGNQGAITRAIIDSISRNPRAPLLADCHVSQSFAP